MRSLQIKGDKYSQEKKHAEMRRTAIDLTLIYMKIDRDIDEVIKIASAHQLDLFTPNT